MIISVDDNSPIDFIPFKCLICTQIIWRDTITFQCLRCNKDICVECITNIINTTNVCPYCRYKMSSIIEQMEIGNLIEDDSLYSSEEEDITEDTEDTNITEDEESEDDKKKCYKCISQISMLIVAVLLLLNGIYLLSIMHNK